MPQHVSLKDLAAATGFTVNTVSRALRDMPDISDNTKAIIKDAAKRMGYLPNYAARMIRTNKSDTIGVIFPDINNPVFGEMFKGIDAVAKKKGHTVLICNTNENYDEEKHAMKTMLERRVDGILMIPSMGGKKTIENLSNMKIPFVLLGRHFFDMATNVVTGDDIFGGYLAGQHLISKGHKKIVYLAGPMRISSVTERLEGLKKAASESGLPENSITVYDTDATLQGGYNATLSLIREGKLKDTRAIFCFSDFIAFGTLKALKENSVSVPDDVAVLGYDNNVFSELSNPPLTTIGISQYNIGKMSAEMLIDQINTLPEERMNKQLLLEPALIIRSTT